MTVAWRDYPLLLREMVLAALGDNCFGMAKAAAYSALLSFFPVLTSAAAILAQTRAAFVTQMFSRFLFEVVPPGTQEAVEYALTVRGHRPVTLLVIAAVLSVLAASGVVGSLLDGFQNAYRIPDRRSIIGGFLINIVLVLSTLIPLSVACTLILFGGWIDRWISTSELGWLWTIVYRAVRYAIAFAAAVAMMSILYYFGPQRRQHWSRVWRGALLATILWMVTTAGFGWYVQYLADYNVLYGSIASSIALIVWLYLMALIVLLGCEFNAEIERFHARRAALYSGS